MTSRQVDGKDTVRAVTKCILNYINRRIGHFLVCCEFLVLLSVLVDILVARFARVQF